MPEGVGEVRFVYSTEPTAQHAIDGEYKNPARGKIFAAQHVPGSLSLEDALVGFYNGNDFGPTVFVCHVTY